MKDIYKYAIAIAVMIAIFAIPFFINGQARFGGADDAGSKAIMNQEQGYRRWATPWWTPPPETESMLFAVEAALGAGLIGYFIGHEKARMKYMKNRDED